MSILEQDEIDSLMESAMGGEKTARQAASAPPLELSQVSPKLQKLLYLQVPIIVHLADRTMPLSDVIELAAGSIIEFSRASDAELDLVVGNRHIGKGQTVKVGENFGLRVTDIGPVEDRIRAMGG